jgi:hypothetical protein
MAALIQQILPSIRSREHFDLEIAQALELHAEETEVLLSQHTELLHQAQQLHQRGIDHKTQLFRQDMAIDKGLKFRDATRDALRLSYQFTTMVMTTDALMATCVFQITTQFNVPNGGAPQPALICYALCISGSFLFLMVSIILAVSMQRIIGRYDVNNELRRYEPCALVHCNFNDYYECHCAGFERWSRVFMFLGSGGTALLGMVSMYMYYVTSFAMTSAWIIFAVPTGLAALILWFGDAVITDTTSDGKRDLVGLTVE